jgi:hypothetical protein
LGKNVNRRNGNDKSVKEKERETKAEGKI